LATTNWTSVTAAITTIASRDGPKPTRTKSRGAAAPGAAGAVPEVRITCGVARTYDAASGLAGTRRGTR
jgi:hypothetical protein